MYLYLPCEKKQEPAHLQINLQPSGEKRLDLDYEDQGYQQGCKLRNSLVRQTFCSINCFLVAPLTVRKRHSRTRCRKRSI